MQTSSIPDITQFLKDFKKVAQKKIIFLHRKKNLDSLSQLGIKIGQAKGIIFQLTYENYYSGPEEDRDNKGYNIWEFGVNVNGEEIYIKLSDDLRFDTAKCISFHKAEFKISYLYKKEDIT